MVSLCSQTGHEDFQRPPLKFFQDFKISSKLKFKAVVYSFQTWPQHFLLCLGYTWLLISEDRLDFPPSWICAGLWQALTNQKVTEVTFWTSEPRPYEDWHLPHALSWSPAATVSTADHWMTRGHTETGLEEEANMVIPALTPLPAECSHRRTTSWAQSTHRVRRNVKWLLCKPLSLGMVCNAATDNWNTSHWTTSLRNTLWLTSQDEFCGTLWTFSSTPTSLHRYCFLPSLNHPERLPGPWPLPPICLPAAALTSYHPVSTESQVLLLKTCKFTSLNTTPMWFPAVCSQHHSNSLPGTCRIWPVTSVASSPTVTCSSPTHQTNLCLRACAWNFCPAPSSARLLLWART